MTDISLPKFKTLYLDPPWISVKGSGGKGCRGAKYDLMTTQDIIDLPIQNIVHPDGCHIYVWVINNQVDDGFKCLEKWGFKYQTMITWHKTGNPGIGWYFRGTSESCLFGTSGKLPFKKINGRIQQGVTSFVAPRLEHSVKPELMRWMIERVSYPPYCEIFARRFVPNWTCVGNEINITIQDFLAGVTATQAAIPPTTHPSGFGFTPTKIKMPHGIPTDHDYMLEPSFFEDNVEELSIINYANET